MGGKPSTQSRNQDRGCRVLECMDVGLIAVVVGALLLVSGLITFTKRRIKQ
ncbi:hypothetical protein Aglo01_53950 [Actinokineospora globicatena]|nr:hypothetical protein Aglo01_53950 [Actinokineospora globicatena]GLW88107.1 hypothetical protein Aglo02_57460 [Actinokineospora globicatena]